MPLSYHGFGPAAILIMVACVIVGELFKKIKQRNHHH
jgi:hypothetical protein